MPANLPSSVRRLRPAIALLALLPALAPGAAAATAPRRPDVLVITVDTLRTDRLSGYGYARPTTPNIDRLLRGGVRFAAGRTVEPLTTPSMAAMLTSLYPHEHGATRNGLRVLPGLVSLPGILHGLGYVTAAVVGNWTLRGHLSGLNESFDSYEEVLTRKRWFGLVRSEATADDLTAAALAWARANAAGDPRAPFFLWVHYVDPHAPYRLHADLAPALGIAAHGDVAPSDRYDTEVATADRAIGALLSGLEPYAPPRRTIVVFAADHGESLGEHGSWGHGRELYDTTLRIPLGLAWPGHLRPAVVDAPASILDVAPTVLGLLGLPVPKRFHGFDWAPTLRGEAPPPERRTLRFEAHRGAVMAKHASARARARGLLEVGRLEGGEMEVVRVTDGQRQRFDVRADPGEVHNLVDPRSPPSPDLRAWEETVSDALWVLDKHAVPPMDPETAARLRSLGYLQ